jgi:1,4-dihydroxy-6-naphthoate synthase
VAREPVKPAQLRGKMIAIPGMLTTAYLMMQLYDPLLKDVLSMPFDLIMKSVESRNVDAGLIIHESRFTYKDHGLTQVLDLGKWWEDTTGLPIPLGCIVAKRSLGAETINAVDRLIRASVLHAKKHPDDSLDYVRCHAQENTDDVTRKHIKLYVNDFTIDIGPEGERAVRELLRRAEKHKIVERSRKPLFADATRSRAK